MTDKIINWLLYKERSKSAQAVITGTMMLTCIIAYGYIMVSAFFQY